MSVQFSSDRDYVGILNDKTGKYEWINQKTAESYFENLSEELNLSKSDDDDDEKNNLLEK
ncbi:Uncharacterised protein [Enterococcus casseliflavus]|nr:Uncharacterised protein [Enterococcus casseliflavus]